MAEDPPGVFESFPTLTTVNGAPQSCTPASLFSSSKTAWSLLKSLSKMLRPSSPVNRKLHDLEQNLHCFFAYDPLDHRLPCVDLQKDLET